MKLLTYKTVAASGLLLMATSSGMAQESAETPAYASDAAQAASRQFTFTSGANIRKQLLIIGGGSGNAACKLVQAGGVATLPSKLTFSPNCELAGVADPVSTPQSMEYQVQISDNNGGFDAKNVRITLNPPLVVKCDAVAMTAGGDVSVSQLPCQARGGTGATTVQYIGQDGKILSELPGGLKVDDKGGISGKVPDNTDSLKGIEIQFADAGGATVRTPITLDIKPPISMDVENVQFTASDQASRPLDPPRPVANISGGSGQITVQILSEDGKQVAVLPDGLRFNGVTKQLEGSLPMAKDVGEKKYMLKATDQGGGSIRRIFVLKINPPLRLS